MARFVCPACGKNDLGISLTIELPPSGDDDETTLQIVDCHGCHFRGLAVYRESRHGALESESWDHTGYEVDTAALEKIRAAILSCASPEERRCQCEAHKSLGQLCWAAPASGMAVSRQFNMRLVRG